VQKSQLIVEVTGVIAHRVTLRRSMLHLVASCLGEELRDLKCVLLLSCETAFIIFHFVNVECSVPQPILLSTN